MKKSILIFGVIGIILIIAVATVTYAFFSQNDVDFTITLKSAVTATVILEVDTDEASELTPPNTQANNSYAKYAGSGSYAAYRITYSAEADIASSNIYVSEVGFSRNGVADTSSIEYIYLSQSDVFEFGFKLYKNSYPEDEEINADGVTWVSGTGDTHGVSFGVNPFATNDQGTIVFFVRFSALYPDELVPPSCDGMEIYFTINMDVEDAQS